MLLTSPSATSNRSAVSSAQLTLSTGAALIAFASNSLLCRLALGDGAIDAASFTVIRLVAGAVVLILCATLVGQRDAHQPARSFSGGGSGSWRSAAALAGYAVAFSFAYLQLTAGIGALLLFGAVQLTIVGAALYAGERARPLEWTGLGAAVAGLIYLSIPGLTAPPLVGSVLMVAAGIAWGFYTIHGRTVADPLAATTGNFARSVPLVAVAAPLAAVVAAAPLSLSPTGILLAVTSGGLTSALGYVVWYRALRGLSAIRAATVQLAVPVLSAIGGVAFLGERVSVRLVVSGAMILGGIALTVMSRLRSPAARRPATAR